MTIAVMSYEKQNFKIPIETEDYKEVSDYAIKSIEFIVENAIANGENKIVINTNVTEKSTCLLINLYPRIFLK